MNRKHQIIYLILISVGLLLATVAFFWSKRVVIIHPFGPIAESERNLLVFSTLLMLVVVVPVFVLTFVFTWKYHEKNKKAKYDPKWNYSLTLEALWWGIPLVIIAILSALTWTETHRLDPYRPIESDKKPLTIQVVALQWRWLFIYPEQGIATMNFFKFPVNTPVKFEITAEAPMNSFWIPDLGGQIYAMPKMRTELNTITDHVGKYRGSSANLSGKGFANMVFFAEATEEDTFNQWIHESKSLQPLDWQGYKQLAKPSEEKGEATFSLQEPKLFQKIIDQYLAMEGH